MGNIIKERDWVFLTDRLVKFAVVTSSNPTAADMPLSYATTSQQPSDRVRFTEVKDPIVIDIDLADALDKHAETKAGASVDGWRLIELLFNNSSSTGTWTVQAAADEASIDTPTYDSGLLYLWPSPDCDQFARIHSYLWIPDARTETFIRITINDPTPRKPSLTEPSGFETVDYFDIGQIMVGYGYTNGDYDGDVSNRKGTLSIGVDEESKILTSEGGASFPRIRPKSDRRAFTLSFVGANARHEYLSALQALRRDRGLSQALTFIDNLTGRVGTNHRMEDITYGLFTNLQDTQIRDVDYYELVIQMKAMV